MAICSEGNVVRQYITNQRIRVEGEDLEVIVSGWCEWSELQLGEVELLMRPEETVEGEEEDFGEHQADGMSSPTITNRHS